MTRLFNDYHFHWAKTSLLSAFTEIYGLAEYDTKGENVIYVEFLHLTLIPASHPKLYAFLDSCI